MKEEHAPASNAAANGSESASGMTFVTLEPLARNHLAATLRWISDERIRRGLLVGRDITPAQHSAWFAALQEDRSQAIYAALENGAHIGNFGYRLISSQHASGELWMYVGTEHQGRGLGKAMLDAGLAIGFERHSLRKIYLRVHAGNARAIVLYARAGFAVEGLLAREELFRGEPVDMLRMALFRDDWKSTPR
jgi:RimJ/RimL family protein N-acetyltransferase